MNSEILGIHLGDYIFWDEERQTEFVIDEYGWMETNVEGTYKGYKSAECIMPGVHDFTCYLKRGYGRATFHASSDVRNGLITKREAEENLIPLDKVRPNILDYYLKITKYSEQEFYQIMDRNKVTKIENLEVTQNGSTDKRSVPRLFIDDLREWLKNDSNQR
jgi:hypothetical protein